MMVGCDLVFIPRIKAAIETQKERFLNRVFTKAEIQYCKKKASPEKHFATRFAAKEAFLKALGTGLSKGVSFQEISIENDRDGKPCVRHFGKVTQNLQKKKVKGIHVSMTDEENYALAFVVLSS